MVLQSWLALSSEVRAHATAMVGLYEIVARPKIQLLMKAEHSTPANMAERVVPVEDVPG